MIDNIAYNQIISKAELINYLKEFNMIADDALSQLDLMDEILEAHKAKEQV